MSTPDPEAIGEMYLDETSQTKHRYLALGGVILRASDRNKIEKKLFDARFPDLPAMEIGWVKVSRAKLDAYRRFVDVFFDCAGEFPFFDYHSLIVDTHKLDHAAHNGGSREVGFNKEVYQLCDKFARLYSFPAFHVYPDSRTTKSSTEELRLILNRGRAKKGDRRDWPFRRIHFRQSCDSQLLQLVDVLLGSTAFHLNGHATKTDASPAKLELSKHILTRAGIADVMKDSPVMGRFTIWHRRLR